MIPFELVEVGGRAAIRVPDDRYAVLETWINNDVFGFEGIEQQLETTRRVQEGTYAESLDGAEVPMEVLDREFNAHRVTIGPERTRIAFIFDDRAAEMPTAEYCAFLEALISRLKDDM